MRTRLLSVALALFAFLAAATAAQQAPAGDNPAASAATAAAPLDYDVFKNQVQPIFLKKRPGHARCYACHALGAGEGGPTNALRLQVLSPGATTWDDEQSRRNFTAIRAKVVPGNLRLSKLVVHPLRYESGGDQWHGGGGQFSSANDPDWQVLAAWVMGKPVGASADTGAGAGAAPTAPPRSSGTSQTLKRPTKSSARSTSST
jgi:hypothetical protein